MSAIAVSMLALIAFVGGFRIVLDYASPVPAFPVLAVIAGFALAFFAGWLI